MATIPGRVVLALVALLGFGAGPSRADDADPKKLTEQMEKLLEAYNKDDFKGFFGNWAKASEALATEAVYDALYKNGSKKMLGDYKKKTIKIREKGSVLTGDDPLVYFEAEFSKEKAGLIAVNFTKEAGGYKFVQVTMQQNKDK